MYIYLWLPSWLVVSIGSLSTILIIEYCHRYGSCSSFTNLEQKKMDPPLNISHPNVNSLLQEPLHVTCKTGTGTTCTRFYYTYIAHPCSAIFYIIQMVLRRTGTLHTY